MPINIRISKPGLLSTLQDLGRPGWLSSGVPAGGAADVYSHRVANYLAGNTDQAATLEYCGGQWTAVVDTPGLVALYGAGGVLYVDGRAAGEGRVVEVSPGVLLEIRPSSGGVYAYLSTPGGWDAPLVLGSRSVCVPGKLGGRALLPGDVLCGCGEGMAVQSTRLVPARAERRVIRVLAGAEMSLFGKYGERFFENRFRVGADRNRMGIRLDPLTEPETAYPLSGNMVSTAVCPGTVQMPPDGRPIVLSADAQTTGGYPRIAQVVLADLPFVAQIPSFEVLSFQLVTLEEAERLLYETERALQKIRKALA